MAELEHHTFHYFLEWCNPNNGLVADSAREGAPASIAVVGLALAAYPIGVERAYLSRADAVARTLAALRFFWNSPHGTICPGSVAPSYPSWQPDLPEPPWPTIQVTNSPKARGAGGRVVVV